jgi:hypothetical protein
MENNMIIFDSDVNDPNGLDQIIDNFALVNAGEFDVLILRTGRKKIDTGKDIHVWIKRADQYNANLMILLGFIISAHPDWKKTHIKIFMVSKKDEIKKSEASLHELVLRGRLPVTAKNIQILEEEASLNIREMINKYSADAGLVMAGFHGDHLKHAGRQIFEGYEIDSMLFVNSHDEKAIE